jgi:hypothetical protein
MERKISVRVNGKKRLDLVDLLAIHDHKPSTCQKSVSVELAGAQTIVQAVDCCVTKMRGAEVQTTHSGG